MQKHLYFLPHAFRTHATNQDIDEWPRISLDILFLGGIAIHLNNICYITYVIIYPQDLIVKKKEADALAVCEKMVAAHKLEMEQRVLDIDPDAVMLRAEWMYDYYPKRANYLMQILNATGPVRFSSRQYRGITYVKEVVQNMERVLRLPGGAYNFGSETQKSMYEITEDILQKSVIATVLSAMEAALEGRQAQPMIL